MTQRLLKLFVFLLFLGHVTACDNARVYGSVGVSSYGGLGGSSRVGGSISIGGRIR
ncbi:MAG TPA: hypothetical protein VMW70_12410 [Burkholderiales bacterium]|nr:hypothetical protein [Burkholderiales bacterium]